MGGTSAPVRTSLERLKTLDDLPDFDSRLREAQELCTHSARAEMILKWLASKLKSSDDLRQRPNAWHLLSSCVRLLPCQKTAVSLGQSGFIEALRAICTGPRPSLDTIIAAAKTLHLLFELSESSQGPPIKSLLSIHSVLAASICGGWLHHVCELGIDAEHGGSSLRDQLLLDSILRLWDMRKQIVSDDEIFCKDCLVPVSMLLTTVYKPHSNELNKRKRGHSNTGSIDNVRTSLESLIAKHVVIPARMVFLLSTGSESRQAQHQKGDSDQPALKERLGYLRTVLRGEASADALNCIPQILDIAIRSIPMPTPRHRSRERPWIEFVFSTLRNCCPNQLRPVQNQTLVALLDVIRHHGVAISSHVLFNIVKEQACAGGDPHKAYDWRLLAKVVQLDANVFTDRVLVESTFDAVSLETSGRLTANMDATNFLVLRDLIKDDIVIPVMKAHAQSRSLDSFVDCWHQELMRPQASSTSSIWCELILPFSELVEEVMTTEQVIRLIGRFETVVAATANTHESRIKGQLLADFTLLEALIRGIRGEHLVSTLQEGLDTLLESLLTLVETENSIVLDVVPQRFWQLLSEVVGLWFPTWAVRQINVEVVTKRVASLLTSNAFRRALSQSTAVGGSETYSPAARSAQMFIGTLCAHFQGYEQSADLVRVGIDQLGEGKDAALPVLLKYPSLLVRLQTQTRKDLFSALILSASQLGVCIDKALKATIWAVELIGDQSLVSDLIAAALEPLKTKCIGKSSSPSHLELVPVSVLCSIDAASILPEQRTEILEVVGKLSRIQSGLHGPVQLQHRLALVLRMLTVPSGAAVPLTDYQAIKVFLDCFDHPEEGETSAAREHAMGQTMSSFENLLLFEEVTRSVVRSWLGLQETERGRELLLGLSTSIANYIQLYSREKSLEGGLMKAVVVVTKTSIAMLEDGAREHLLQRLDHRKTETLRPYIRALNDNAEALVSSANKSGMIHYVLDALSAFPRALWTAFALKDELNRVVRLVQFVVDLPDHAESFDANAEGFPQIAVICFRLLCSHSDLDGRDLSVLATRVLQRDLSATDHATILSTYEGVLQNAGLEWKLAALSDLAEGDLTPAGLLLQRSVIRTLSKEDVESAPRLSSKQVWHQTLQVILLETSLHYKRTALQSLTSIAKEKPFMVHQHGIEQVISTLHRLLKTEQTATALFMDICSLLSVLFAHHRSRMQGRSHLLVALFQAMISSLFLKSDSPSSNGAVASHARALARLLETFCSPSQMRRRGKGASDLVDEARRAQARAGQYAQYILHQYCSQILTGSLGEGVREALVPGLWVLIEAIETNNADGIKSLSAAMNNSERTVLRSVYDDWKRFGKWEGS